jgi:hypothetical protein
MRLPPVKPLLYLIAMTIQQSSHGNFSKLDLFGPLAKREPFRNIMPGLKEPRTDRVVMITREIGALDKNPLAFLLDE